MEVINIPNENRLRVVPMFRIKHAAIKRGEIVYVGKRHCNCFAVMAECGVSHTDSIQGFVDESGQFLDRKQALVRATHFGQIIKKHPPVDQLCSEDLY